MADIDAILAKGLDLGSGAAAGYHSALGRAANDEQNALAKVRPLIPQAVAGDAGAMGQVAQASPRVAGQLAPILARMDANQAARLKQVVEWAGNAAGTVLALPAGERAGAYEAARQAAQAQGLDTKSWPAAYDEAWTKMQRDHAVGAKAIFEEQEKMRRHVTPGARAAGGGSDLEPMGGPVPAAPGPRADAGPLAAPQPQIAQASGLPPGGQPVAPPQVAGVPAEPQIVQGDAPGPTPQVSGSQVVTPPGTAPAVPPPQGAIWSVDPSTQGAQMMGHRAKPGGPLLPAEIAGHFVYRLPNGQTVLYKPRAETPPERIQPPVGFEHAPEGGLRPIRGGPQDPEIAKRLNIPPGYQPGPDGGLAPIPGGPADTAVLERNAAAKRAANEKTIPQTIVKGIQENINALKQIDRVETALDKVPESTGGPGSVAAANIPGVGWLQNRIDKEGVALRALIADIGSLKIHDRSGAAVTASEYPRLRPFIPTIADDAATVRDKLANFRAEYESAIRDTTSYYGPETGFHAYTPALDYLEGKTKGTPGVPKGQGPNEKAALPPAQRLSPAEAAKLPPGTPFIGEDGIPRMRH